jgi:hypothetical protein
MGMLVWVRAMVGLRLMLPTESSAKNDEEKMGTKKHPYNVARNNRSELDSFWAGMFTPWVRDEIYRIILNNTELHSCNIIIIERPENYNNRPCDKAGYAPSRRA